MTKNKELQLRKDKVIAKGQKNLYPIYIDKASNSELWDVEGKRYIDFGAGIAVVNTGHNHPKINEAMHQQIDSFTHTCFMINPYESGVKLAEKLSDLAPISEAKSVFLSTGAEAVENAIKISKAYTKRTGIISFNGGFHGRTNMCLGLTGKIAPYKRGFGPFPINIFHIPFPIEYYGITIEDSLNALKNLFASTIDPEDIAAMIIEPVQGEGGFNIAPIEFLKELRKICTEHGIVLICDEIQTGFARTGTFFATEKYNIEPDLITVAKGLAGGFPLSAVIGKSEIMDASGSLGGTFGGSPIGCAAALAVIQTVQEEQLCEKANKIGDIVSERFYKLKKQFPESIGNIRNSGAMIAVEFVEGGNVFKPNTALVKSILNEAINKGLIMLSCGINGNAIRVLTPLTIPLNQLNEGLDIFEEIINNLLKN
ncbi:4-aminobutyrate aminotransferase / (S)-3-amino-2-methylpropionate transaminase [Tenacibaculum sp. MAR_2009_124]|uniref:4-aminobutyrate--2-oxoglutarate transaminase n=1 Tax=Tenacibaculum sp. MAR_2009_124 TaxID=1250059 RepID=UPI0008979DA8|nr:4-aminobutyrate--2-oxoglutarate transaminase [Tenacibaculum sp. MAR_2009_124]SEC93958.1 4-aminobutyrate aminotransferase / (S)-3-amino-2-methylpropionate transaminase [Tenacibaculum sp. MAR_2009_124]